jgi:DNA-binding transcriptional LysR family regulator
VLAKAGTMVAAAQELKLSQPAVSQMIAGLEQSAGRTFIKSETVRWRKVVTDAGFVGSQ